jgi:RNA polymerase sigma factor (sigma-70 family)
MQRRASRRTQDLPAWRQVPEFARFLLFQVTNPNLFDRRDNSTYRHMGLVKHITDSVVARALVKRGEDLWRLLSRYKRSAPPSSNVNEETYLRLLRLPRSDLVGDPLAYVYRVSANVLDEEELRQQPDSSSEAPRPLEGLFLAAEHPEGAGGKVQQVLQSLSPLCRAVLVLHRRDGMTYDEIGERLGISPAMVRQQLAAGLRQCCLQLQKLD